MKRFLSKIEKSNKITILCFVVLVGGLVIFGFYKKDNCAVETRDEEKSYQREERKIIDIAKYNLIMPAQIGTKWIYEGKRIFYDPKQKKTIETIGQKIVEIIKIEEVGVDEAAKLKVFTSTSYKNGSDFGMQSDDEFWISSSGYAFDGNNLAFFPLTKGQRLTSSDLERTDNMYMDYVSAVSIKNMFGKNRRCYDISYYGLPDESLVVFCEGIGYVRDKYKHHGTPNEWDYNLIKIEPASKFPLIETQ